MENTPLPELVVFLERFVSLLVRVTVAPGTTAPVVSVTTPCTPARYCASEGIETAMANRKLAITSTDDLQNFMVLLDAGGKERHLGAGRLRSVQFLLIGRCCFRLEWGFVLERRATLDLT